MYWVSKKEAQRCIWLQARLEPGLQLGQQNIFSVLLQLVCFLRQSHPTQPQNDYRQLQLTCCQFGNSHGKKMHFPTTSCKSSMLDCLSLSLCHPKGRKGSKGACMGSSPLESHGQNVSSNRCHTRETKFLNQASHSRGVAPYSQFILDWFLIKQL